uniref:Uncharacterized protein n=1 Tax=Nelumbo nucifera TaxID=4432 RepID=A0A822ZDC4_NELNU|nr:TPA_asm: hypothetical protein HUJ06_015738 [Nelumbo nucifera]
MDSLVGKDCEVFVNWFGFMERGTSGTILYVNALAMVRIVNFILVTTQVWCFASLFYLMPLSLVKLLVLKSFVTTSIHILFGLPLAPSLAFAICNKSILLTGVFFGLLCTSPNHLGLLSSFPLIHLNIHICTTLIFCCRCSVSKAKGAKEKKSARANS